MFGIGGFELFIILIFGFLIFGPDKLPDIARTVGKGIARFREVQKDVNDAIGDEKLVDLNDPDQPIKNPVEVLDRVAARQAKAKSDKADGKEAAKPSQAQGTATSAAKDAKPVGPSDEAPSKSEPMKQGETFTERKARYERERAASKTTVGSSSGAATKKDSDAAATGSAPSDGKEL